jgi:hypothetical protein
MEFTGDTWLWLAFILLACVSLGAFITYAFLFVRAASFTTI